MTVHLFRAAVLALPLALAVASTAFSAADKDTASEDPVVAIVNGIKVYRSDVMTARGRLPAQYHGISLSNIYPVIINSIIDRKLVAADARRQGILEDATVKRALVDLEDQFLQRLHLERYVEARMTDAAVKERYEKLVEENRNREEVRARHILVTTEAVAKEIIAELDGGADFAKLAKEKSIGPSAAKGGDLGYFTADKMVADFSKAAFAMKKGETAKMPTKTQFGWHVIKIEDRRALQPLPPEHLDKSLRTTLSREIRSGYIRELRGAAVIERFEVEDMFTDDPHAAGAGAKKPPGKHY